MKPLSELVSKMKEVEADMRKLNNDMPRYMGIEAVKITRENFKEQGFEGESWKERSDKTNAAYDRRGATYKGSVFNSKNKILLQTRKLYNSIQYVVQGKLVEIGVNLNLVPYAQAHNEGLGHQPKRQWIGWGEKMRKRLLERIDVLHKKILKPIK